VDLTIGGRRVQVDPEIVEAMGAGWTFDGRYIVRFPSRGRKEYLHRWVIQACPGARVDHVNGDTPDNRWENLRLASRAQNQHNRGPNRNNKSGFKGVYWHRQRQKWHGAIMVDGRRVLLGLHETAEAAHLAYLEAARRLQGEFAHG